MTKEIKVIMTMNKFNFYIKNQGNVRLKDNSLLFPWEICKTERLKKNWKIYISEIKYKTIKILILAQYSTHILVILQAAHV